MTQVSSSRSREGDGARDATARVLLVGLDGATFDLLDRWVGRGLVPNLARLIQEGTRATFRSVKPPVTAPAWTSFVTGVTPGKHGVFDFRKRVPGQLDRELVSSRDIRVPTMWDLLADAGLEVGLVNVPVTYPPSSRTAFAIADMMTPSTTSTFTHPPTLYQELRPQLGEYIIDAPSNHLTGRRAVAPFLEALEHCTEQRARYIVHLLEHRCWQVAMAVFVGTDRLQHVLWDLLSGELESRPATPELAGYRRAADGYLSRLDRAIGDMLAACPPDTDVFIVSDHGFGPLRRRFKANLWLAKLGLLVPSRRRGLLGRAVARADVLRLRHRVGRWRVARRAGSGDSGTRLDKWRVPFWRWINWPKTRAYTCSISEMGIYVNLEGRELYGCVAPGAEYEAVRNQVIAFLRELRHPETGAPLVTYVAKREEAFPGDQTEQAPDIVFALDDGACTIDVRLEGTLFEKADWRTGTGTHRFEGVFIARGPRIRAGLSVPEVDIVDVAPTVLHLCGVPIPDHMDGRVLTEVLTPEARAFVPRPSGTRRPPAMPDTETGSPYSEEETRQVEERLRGLGYL
jgi:predicted AlkP superfamily phosphohydrolase/phosphomutase